MEYQKSSWSMVTRKGQGTTKCSLPYANWCSHPAMSCPAIYHCNVLTSVSQHNPSEVIIKHVSAGTAAMAATPAQGGIHYHCQHITNHTQYPQMWQISCWLLYFIFCLLECLHIASGDIRCISSTSCIWNSVEMNVLHEVIDKFCAVQLRIVLCTINSSPLSAVVRHVCAKYLQEKSSKLITEFATTTWPPWCLPSSLRGKILSSPWLLQTMWWRKGITSCKRNNSQIKLTIYSDCQIHSYPRSITVSRY